MKIQIEILNKSTDDFGHIDWIVDKSRIVDISTEKNDTTIQQARTRLTELKSTLSANQKIRVLEYHNDDSDQTRKPCKILYEG